MAFDVVAPNKWDSVKTKGNVSIDYVQRGKNSNINSVYVYDGVTTVTNDNKKTGALYTRDDKVYSVLMEIVGSDSVLELKDLDRINEVEKKYKGFVEIDKKLEEGRVVLKFSNGYNMTIDFETDEEQKIRDIASGDTAERGPKKEYYKQDLIDKYKDKYEVKKETRINLKGQEYNVYTIKAKVDLNLSELESDLGIRHEAVQDSNDNYKKYDYNGHYIGNKPMKDVTIKIPTSELGYTKDDRNPIIRILSALYQSLKEKLN